MSPERPNISPVVVSTALGLSGRGVFPYTLLPAYRRLLHTVKETGTTVLAKSATRFPRRGNVLPWNPLTWRRYVRKLPDSGLLNAYGLTNPGAERAARAVKVSRDLGLKVTPNFYPEFIRGTAVAIRDTLEALEIYQAALGPGFQALELNYSCPNSQEEIRENVAQGLKCAQAVRQQFPGLFLIVKVSVRHPYEFAQELEGLGVNALHAVNTVPYDLVFPPPGHPPSPLARVGGGGVSGGPAFDLAYRYNAGLRPKVGLFLIMGCGVRNQDDVHKYFDLGADAVSLCTLALRAPGAARRIILAHNG
jgi:dihydroorotate dehydrogenase (NAD+) catalytic subunit